jgi:uncharacterized repeat protein (TIGR03943 family)
VLFLLGGAILRISATDVYLRYVKAGLRPFLIVSGVLLIVIAAVTLYREVFAPARPLGEGDGGSSTGAHAPAPGHAPAHAAPHPGAHAAVAGDEEVPAPPGAAGNDGDGHAHGHAGPRVAWLLVVPVFAIFLIGPPALGSFAASRGGTSVAKQSDYAPLPAGDPVTLPVLDYASRAVWDRGASLTDRRVRLTGFVSPRPGGGVYLTRMILTCCAADGRPVKVGLSGTVPAGLPADTWIEVTGRYDPRVDKDRANNESIPYLAAEALREVTQPTQPYEQ